MIIGLSKLDIITIFKRHLKVTVVTDSLINTVAMAVGEVVKKITKGFFKTSKLQILIVQAVECC